MTLLILIRHGQSVTNRDGILSDSTSLYPLTDVGRTQAIGVADELRKKLSVSSLYTSPVLRAKQTAQIIGTAIGKKPIVDKRLSERAWGIMEGKPARLGEWRFHMTKAESKSVESWRSIEKRMAGFADSVSGRHETIVAVSHVDPIAALTAHSIGMPDAELQFYALVPVFASMSIFCETGGDYKIMATGLPTLTQGVLKEIGRCVKGSGRP